MQVDTCIGCLANADIIFFSGTGSGKIKLLPGKNIVFNGAGPNHYF